MVIFIVDRMIRNEKLLNQDKLAVLSILLIVDVNEKAIDINSPRLVEACHILSIPLYVVRSDMKRRLIQRYILQNFTLDRNDLKV